MATVGIWRAAWKGDLDEVKRLVGQDPGLLDAKDGKGKTPLMEAFTGGDVGVVQWLLDRGAPVNGRQDGGAMEGGTALSLATSFGHIPVVRLLLERGADPLLASYVGFTPLMWASAKNRLLGHPIAKTTLNKRNINGETALWMACYMGRGGGARALLEGGADPTIASNDGTTPMAAATKGIDEEAVMFGVTAEARRECVAVLEVRFSIFSSSPP
jgi:ankyrin repeat protein